MSQPGQAEIVWSTSILTASINDGFMSGPIALTGVWDGSNDAFYSVYVVVSGVNPPTSVIFADLFVAVNPIHTLVIPTIASTASVNYVGPGISGANVANAVGFFNSSPTLNPAILVNPGAGASWYKIVVVGR